MFMGVRSLDKVFLGFLDFGVQQQLLEKRVVWVMYCEEVYIFNCMIVRINVFEQKCMVYMRM